MERNISVAQLQKIAGYSSDITTRLMINTYVSSESEEEISRVLNCKVDDIVEFDPDENGGNKDDRR